MTDVRAYRRVPPPQPAQQRGAQVQTLGMAGMGQAAIGRERLEAVVAGGRLPIVWQPVVSLATREILGYEALARFAEVGGGEELSPSVWFESASAHGLREALELVAVRSACAELGRLPETSFVSLNISPATVASPDLESALVDNATERIVLEIAEDAITDASPEVEDAFARLRDKGVRIALDDTGSGLVSLRQLLGIRADIIKIDTDVVRGIDSDVACQAIAFALKSLAERSGAMSLAEGVETDDEAEMLASLGVEAGQGYLFGRPEPISPV